ncbi:MAG: NnrS family protein [bacterium]|nr:NnrS family protein [bacterium]
MSPIQRLFSEPHRLYFTSGALALLLPMAWWGHYLALRLIRPPELYGNPLAVHAFGLLFGAFPLAGLGFLFTAFPRWCDSLDHLGKSYLGPWWTLSFGLIFYFFQLWSQGPWGRIGAFLLFVGLLWAWLHLARLWKAGRQPDKRQPLYLLLVFFGGVAGSGLAALYQYFPNPALYNTALALGVYFFWPGLVLVIGWRLLPFFTESRLGPIGCRSMPWALPLWIVGLAVKATGQVLDFKQLWLLSDGLLLGVTLVQFYHWKLWRRKEMMLSYLYLALAWFPVSLLFGLAAGWDRLSGGYELHLDMAGVHALTVGMMASMLFAMLSRVSMGHFGLRPAATWLTNTVFFLLQLAALSRVGLELALIAQANVLSWLSLPAGLWLAAFGLWALRFLPFYFKPRADDAPEAPRSVPPQP